MPRKNYFSNCGWEYLLCCSLAWGTNNMTCTKMNWKAGNKYYWEDCVYSSIYFVVFWFGFCFLWLGLTDTQWLAWTSQRAVWLCCRTLFWLGGLPSVAPCTEFYIRGLTPTSSCINFMCNATFLSCLNKPPNLKNQNKKCSHWNICFFPQNIL